MTNVGFEHVCYENNPYLVLLLFFLVQQYSADVTDDQVVRQVIVFYNLPNFKLSRVQMLMSGVAAYKVIVEDADGTETYESVSITGFHC